MSESEEMYLVTLARLIEGGAEEPVPVSLLAQELCIQPVSANQMIRRLEEAGLVAYTPYKGVSLAPEGERLALRLLRHRRLWQVFLVEHLKMNSAQANELACRLEHIVPDQAAERLADFLGDPAVSPQGKPIPTSLASASIHNDIPLSRLNVGAQSQVTRLEADEAADAFLAAEGVEPGAPIQVLGVGGAGGILISLGERRIHLGPEVTEKVWVEAPDPTLLDAIESSQRES
jgi:DtxR family Mn-dependent transcriptional regulator